MLKEIIQNQQPMARWNQTRLCHTSEVSQTQVQLYEVGKLPNSRIKKWGTKNFRPLTGVCSVLKFRNCHNKYEVWNFKSGNYLFTTDTK